MPVCPSVRTSVCHTPVLCRKFATAKYIPKLLFSPSVATTLCTKRYGSIPTKIPLIGSTNATALWKKSHFRPIARFILKMIQDRPIVTMEYKWEIVPKLTNGTNLNDLEGPFLTKISRSHHFLTLNISETEETQT